MSQARAAAIAQHRVILLRHGNTFALGDVVTRVGARTDLPLVDSGVRQAEAVGAFLRATGVHVDAAFCSPLRRTRETAEAVLRAAGQSPPVLVAAALTEIDHGPDENQPEDAVRARVGEDALRRWEEDAIPPAGWNVDPAATANAWRAFHATAMPGETRLVVTSNGAARFALAACGFAPLPKLRTGAFGQIAFGADGAAALASWDQRPV